MKLYLLFLLMDLFILLAYPIVYLLSKFHRNPTPKQLNGKP